MSSSSFSWVTRKISGPIPAPRSVNIVIVVNKSLMLSDYYPYYTNEVGIKPLSCCSTLTARGWSSIFFN